MMDPFIRITRFQIKLPFENGRKKELNSGNSEKKKKKKK